MTTITPAEIKTIRCSLKLTQEKFAQRINKSVDTVRAYEQNKLKPSAETAATIRALALAPNPAP